MFPWPILDFHIAWFPCIYFGSLYLLLLLLCVCECVGVFFGCHFKAQKLRGCIIYLPIISRLPGTEWRMFESWYCSWGVGQSCCLPPHFLFGAAASLRLYHMYFVLCIICHFIIFFLYIWSCFIVCLHLCVHLFQEQKFEANLHLQVIRHCL